MGGKFSLIFQFREDSPILLSVSLVYLFFILLVTVLILYVTVWLLKIYLSLSYEVRIYIRIEWKSFISTYYA